MGHTHADQEEDSMKATRAAILAKTRTGRTRDRLHGGGPKLLLRMSRVWPSGVLWALIFVTPLTAIAQARYAVEATPGWVRRDAPAVGNDAPAREAQNGVEYLIVDRQVRLTPQGSDTYSEFVQRLVSEAGVEEMSSLSIDFDPHSDRLILHSLQVRRGAQVIDQLKKARITVLQRERDLEQGLLDGTLTFTAVLEDIRPGDIVAYSFTLHSNDPVLGNRYNEAFSTQWATPVRWARLRLLQPADRVIHIDQVGVDLKPVIRHDGGTRETTWQWRDLAGIPSEDEQPSWNPQYPRIRLSEWGSWQAIAQWAVTLFRHGPLSPAMQALVDQWRQEAADDAGRIIAALRFVQDNVRYTGIEIGPGAYQPTDPARVLERRYGDCKDKALLLATLLQAMNIDAQPALVSTWLRSEVENALPGPRMFDHVIVRIRSGGRTYWFDATQTLQGGTLQTANQAHFGAALVIAPGVQKLERMPDAVLPQPTTEVTEFFDLAAGTRARGTMQVKSIYRGADADNIRRSLQASTSEQLTRSYLDYYRGWYSGIKSSAPLRIKDDRAANRVEVVERYALEPAFEEKDDGKRRFDINPHVVAALAKAPKLVERSTPLSVGHPRNVRYKATVLLPEDWAIDNDTTTVQDAAFVYDSKIEAIGRRFTAQFDFRTLADHVDAARVPEYARKLERVRDDASYWFTSGGEAAPQPQSAASVNIWLILAALLGAAGGYVLLGFLRRRIPEVKAIEPGWPSGIAGWLLLPMLNTIVLPFSIAASLYGYRPHLDPQTWNAIGAGGGDLRIQLLQLGHFTLIASGVALLMFACYTVFLFFSRRRTYPSSWILLFWSWLAWLALDMCLVIGLPGDNAADVKASAVVVARILTFCVIWTLYMRRSRRVAATFIRDDATRAPVPRVPAVLPSQPAT
jgi:transglutaminase-like putative cysteine protease